MPDVEGSERRLPNIVITGTPGTGKSTHAQLLVDASPVPLQHLNISEIAKEKKLYENYDEEWQTYIVDEDKARRRTKPCSPTRLILCSLNVVQVLDELEPLTDAGGLVIDWHTCDVFPERWIDLVVVLRCDHTLLWDRLEKRGYSLKKIQENNESEIMQTVLDDAKESYAEEIVVELKSENTEDLESNVDRIMSWIENWRRDRGFSEHST